MPRSKRAKQITLSKTTEKKKDAKARIVQEIRQDVDKYKYIWIISIKNFRNTSMQELRQEWRHSRLYFGCLRMLRYAFGTSAEDEHCPNLSELTRQMAGDMGVLMTNEPPQVVRDFFDTFVIDNYPRSGFKSNISLTIPAGPLYSTGGLVPMEKDTLMPVTNKQTLESLGLPTRQESLGMGVARLVVDHEFCICKDEQIIDTQQARLLRVFGVQCCDFRVRLGSYYDSHAQKVMTRKVLDQVDVPPSSLAHNQALASIVKPLGNNVFEVLMSGAQNTAPVRVKMPNKFRNTVFVKRGTAVLVDLSDECGDAVKGEITNIVLTKKAWQKMPYWDPELDRTILSRMFEDPSKESGAPVEN